MSSKIQNLTTQATPLSGDVVPYVTDPSGTPLDKKLTFANIETWIKGWIVKGDVGLGNVDNTSDATKNTATAALTNKDLTSGTNTFPTFNQNTSGSAASFTGSLVGDVTGTQGATVVGKINGVSMAGLATGIVKNTTTTGVPSIAVAGDFPTLNQNTTGSAAKLTTARTIAGVSFDGTANIAIASTNLSDTSSIVLLTSTQTVTNKRITKRVVTLTDAATVTPNADTTDTGILTSLSQTTTIANPTGTPTDGQTLLIRIKSSSAQTLSFDTQYRGGADIALPTTTTGSNKTDFFGFMYNSADTKWDIVSQATGY